MKIKILSLFLMILTGAGASPVLADDPVPLNSRDADKILNSLVSGYSDWGKVELNGRLSSSMIPISVSVKIFMEKGKSVMISLRAPLFGEAARVEVNNDSLLIVNKLKHTYCTIPMERINELYPGALTDMQSLLLGRVVVMGQGQLRKRMFGCVDLYAGEDNGYFILPADGYQPERMRYGYTIDATPMLTTMMLTPVDSEDLATLTYRWKKNGSYDVDAYAMRGGRTIEASFSLDSPKYGVSPMTPLELSGKYRPTTLKGVLSF